MERRFREKSTSKQQSDNLKTQLMNNEFSSFVGIDPGARYMFGMVKDEKNLLYKSSKFRHHTKEFNRKTRLKTLTDSVMCSVKKDRENIQKQKEITISRKLDYREFTSFTLKHFQKLQNSSSRKVVSRLKWDKQILVQKFLDKKANQITKTRDERKTFIAYGNGKMPPFIKGYVKTPLKKFYLALKKNENCVVYLTDEFRTTKLCSTCHKVCKTSQSPHRFQVCPNCKKVWNRDINAARNILCKALSYIKTGKVPVNFARES
jgi:transposase